MTTKKLLTGVALAALLSGGALAQTVVNPVGGAGEFDGQTFASEFGGTLDGNVRLNFGLDGVFAALGAGGVVTVDFNLTNATFDGIVPAGAWTPATDTDCSFGAPSLGGGAGSSTVQFTNVNQLNECDPALGVPGSADDGFINLPIVVTNNGSPVSIEVVFTATADGGVYPGDSETIVLADFAQALDYSITAGAAGSGLFNAAGEALTGSGDIGILDVAAFPAGIEADVGVLLAAATDLAIDGELVVTFPAGADGLDPAQVDLNGVACTQGAAPADNEFTCSAVGLNAIAAHVIDVTNDAVAGSVIAQTPTATFTVNPIVGNTVAGATGNLAEIEVDNGLGTSSYGDFEWVRFGDGGTESNFRIQLDNPADAASVSKIQIVVARDGNGVSAGTYDLPIGTDVATEARIQGSTITFNSRALSAAAGGATGNADVEIVVEFADANPNVAFGANGTIERQLVNRAPSSFVATPGLE